MVIFNFSWEREEKELLILLKFCFIIDFDLGK